MQEHCSDQGLADNLNLQKEKDRAMQLIQDEKYPEAYEALQELPLEHRYEVYKTLVDSLSKKQ